MNWINPKEKLPKNYERVIIVANDGYVTIGEKTYTDDWIIYISAEDEVVKSVRAWMPLPEPYEEREGAQDDK